MEFRKADKYFVTYPHKRRRKTLALFPSHHCLIIAMASSVRFFVSSSQHVFEGCVTTQYLRIMLRRGGEEREKNHGASMAQMTWLPVGEFSAYVTIFTFFVEIPCWNRLSYIHTVATESCLSHSCSFVPFLFLSDNDVVRWIVEQEQQSCCCSCCFCHIGNCGDCSLRRCCAPSSICLASYGILRCL